jgi:hypothetical protein
MTKMIFDTCQRLEGSVWCSVVRDLIVERWQTIFSDPSTIPQSFWNNLYKTKQKTITIFWSVSNGNDIFKFDS